ncbi:hypothetical protein [Nocardiopsis sp. HUAS JQ3]|uniref:hypothetical protein n=1 Tax=Nocardiopsis sp. HUAS JQ3 TaxID=3061629 RepID=UPI0023AA1852|nr:hypothetical protein [Nocardiopsis sp. HUAS JQ3]WDZ88841.1 hypothetical protein PV789_17935 [Nocardiopsis sp. HUAS JQ3]
METDLGFSSGLDAEAMANAMAGLSDMFDHLMEEARSRSEHARMRTGYAVFLDKYVDHIAEVEENGLRLAENIQAGVAEAAETDLRSAEDYSHAWPDMRSINF